MIVRKQHEQTLARHPGRSWIAADSVWVAALLLVGARAHAQSAPAPAAASDATLGEVVVTAEKREESLQKVPISMTVVDGKALDKQSSGGALEALALLPGISESTSDAGGMTQISMRGVAPAVPFGDGSTTVGYYIDGVPFALVRSAAVPNMNDYDMSRIEVLRGPQGTVYGATALNGVVHIITKDADPTQFEAKARVGGAGTEGGSASYRVDGALNVPLIPDKLAFRLVAGYDHDGGWIDQPHLGVKNANSIDLKDVRLKIDYRPTEDLKIDLTSWYSYDKEPAASYGVNAVQQETYNPTPSTTHYFAFNGKVEWELPYVSLSSSSSYLKLGQTIYTDYDNAITHDQQTHDSTDSLYSNLPARVITEELLANSKDAGDWRWQTGFFYRNAYDERYQTLPALLGPHNISWHDDSKSYAVFGQATRTFDDDHFELSGGLRYFHDDYGTSTILNPTTFLSYVNLRNSSQAVTPRVVAAWLPNPDTNIYATYSVGFRSGLEQSPLITQSFPQFPPANPDKLYNYEIGAKGRVWGGLVTYDASVYYIKWKGVQQNGELQLCTGTPVVCAPLGGTVNGVSASGVGYDLGLAFHPAAGLILGFDVSQNNLTNDENVYPNGVGIGPNNGAVYLAGDRTPFSAKTTADVYVSYRWPLTEHFDATWKTSYNYRSKQILILNTETANGVNFTSCNNGNFCYSSDSPQTLNASLEISTHNNQSLTLYGTNLTNWDGLLIPANTANTAFRQRPRTIGLMYETRF